MMKQLKGGLDAPLSGMSTAFSSSLFGLAGSLILGFLDLQLGQAMGRFFNELEDWLSAFARFNDRPGAADANTGALAAGMSEEAARALIHLGNSIAAGEDNRAKVLDQLTNVNMTLAALNEALSDDRRLREQLAQLNAGIAQLSADLAEDRSKSSLAVTTELRTLAGAINKMAAGNRAAVTPPRSLGRSAMPALPEFWAGRAHELYTLGKSGITLRYAYLSQRGYYPEDLYKANQDAFKVIPAFNGDTSTFFMGVFDGHGSDGDAIASRLFWP